MLSLLLYSLLVVLVVGSVYSLAMYHILDHRACLAEAADAVRYAARR